MSIFATQPMSIPPPSYSSTRKQPPSYVPSLRPLTSVTPPRPKVPPTAPSTSKNTRTWFSSMFSSTPLFQDPEHDPEINQNSSLPPPPSYKPTSPTSASSSTLNSDSSSPSIPPPQYSTIQSTRSRTLPAPKPTWQNPYIETDFAYEEYELQCRDEREGDERDSGDWCCNWFWVGPPSATSLPWEGWYIF